MGPQPACGPQQCPSPACLCSRIRGLTYRELAALVKKPGNRFSDRATSVLSHICVEPRQDFACSWSWPQNLGKPEPGSICSDSASVGTGMHNIPKFVRLDAANP